MLKGQGEVELVFELRSKDIVTLSIDPRHFVWLLSLCFFLIAGEYINGTFGFFEMDVE